MTALAALQDEGIIWKESWVYLMPGILKKYVNMNMESI